MPICRSTEKTHSPSIARTNNTQASLFIQTKITPIHDTHLRDHQHQQRPCEVNRLQLYDSNVGQLFLIDSGADVSVIPKSPHQQDDSHSPPLYAANGSTIKTYGTKLLNLNRDYYWNFVIADVSQHIIGADFLLFHNLIIDLCGQRLLDGKTNDSITITCAPVNTIAELQQNDFEDPYTALLNKYKPITTMTEHTQINAGITHHIETAGPPIFAKASRRTNSPPPKPNSNIK